MGCPKWVPAAPAQSIQPNTYCKHRDLNISARPGLRQFPASRLLKSQGREGWNSSACAMSHAQVSEQLQSSVRGCPCSAPPHILHLTQLPHESKGDFWWQIKLRSFPALKEAQHSLKWKYSPQQRKIVRLELNIGWYLQNLELRGRKEALKSVQPLQ